jgi:hypothetical protein
MVAEDPLHPIRYMLNLSAPQEWARMKVSVHSPSPVMMKTMQMEKGGTQASRSKE